MDGEFFFNAAYATFLVGTLLLTRTILKNRGALKDFDVYGSLLTFFGMIFSGIAVLTNGIYISFILLLPTLIFWGMAFFFSASNKFRKVNNEKP